MTLRRILPLAAAAVLAAGCNAGDVTYSAPESEVTEMGVNTAPGAPRMNGVQMGGSGNITEGDTTATSTSNTSAVAPTDSSNVTGRGVNMIGGG